MHALTRREILRFVTAEAKTRADQVQTLLNLSGVEAVRKTLVSVHNDLKREADLAKRDRDVARQDAAVTAGLTRFDHEQMLEAVNEGRLALGGQRIEAAKSGELRKGIAGPAGAKGEAAMVDANVLASHMRIVAEVSTEAAEAELAGADAEIRQHIALLNQERGMRRAVEVLRLVRAGMELIDETGACPLCDAEWPLGELREHLEAKVTRAESAQTVEARLAASANVIIGAIDRLSTSLGAVRKAAVLLGPKEHVQWLDDWLDRLQALRNAARDPVSAYPPPGWTESEIRHLAAPGQAKGRLQSLHATAAGRFCPPSPSQAAWERLTKLEANLRALEGRERRLEDAQRSAQMAAVLADAFEQARDGVLGQLYENVKDRFVSFYKALHGEDEADFDAKIAPDGAGVDFKVDFYGRGMHPPHAMHSEGHQDSMGLCLYLALAETVGGTEIGIIALDDVMMSIDGGHRGAVCRLLRAEFRERQFLITTHDTAWATQLRNEGVVAPHDVTELYAWTVDAGPRTRTSSLSWDRISADLEGGNVSDAAVHLRRGMEGYLDLVCERLRARTIHKSDQRWELGDLLPAAESKYRGLLKAAKASANSWSNEQDSVSLEELESVFAQIMERTRMAEWAVNPAVHYSRWFDIGAREFGSIYEAFRDLYTAFRCAKCNGILHVLLDARRNESVLRCDCGAVNWNLLRKVKPAAS